MSSYDEFEYDFHEKCGFYESFAAPDDAEDEAEINDDEEEEE